LLSAVHGFTNFFSFFSIMGIEMYEKQCRDTIDGWKGFDVVSAAA
jgi:hypothetical protein